MKLSAEELSLEREREKEKERFVIWGRFRKAFTKKRKGKRIILSLYHQHSEFHQVDHKRSPGPDQVNHPPSTTVNIFILFVFVFVFFFLDSSNFCALQNAAKCQPKFLIIQILFLYFILEMFIAIINVEHVFYFIYIITIYF